MADIFELSDRAVEMMADADPLLATFAGVAGRDHRWPDLSPAGHAERDAMFRQLVAEAEATPTPTADAVLAQRVLIAEIGLELEAYADGAHLRDLNSIASPFQGLKDVFDLMGQQTDDEWSRLLVRLETLGRPLAGYRECLAAGVAAGDVVARRQVEAVIGEARAAAEPGAGFDQLLDALAESGVGDEGTRDRLTAAAASARGELASFADWLETTYLPAARTEDAVGHERYVAEARRHLGMTIDPHETYAWGWSEIDRLWARLTEVCAVIDADASVPDVLHALQNDPTHAAQGVDAFIGLMQERQETALAQLAGTHFEVPAQIRTIEVKPGPAGGALAPSYTPPSEDFSRPGCVWYPLGEKTVFPLFEEVTTAHHEGFPGHHLQIGVQIARGDTLSRFHRVIAWSPGSGEGWALYAEHLMGELGYLDRPEYEVGLLVAQLLRACRIVIDIGLHLDLPIPDDAPFAAGESWTYEIAASALQTHAFQSEEVAGNEVTRYLGWPGQAISYKVGERVILDLRTALVDDGDVELKDFHSRVLDVGSVGLDLLKEMVLA